VDVLFVTYKKCYQECAVIKYVCMNNSFLFSFVTWKDKNLQLTIRQQNSWRH